MSQVQHIVCPHCHTTNRVRQADLGQALGARFNIRSIPSLALFANGLEVARQLVNTSWCEPVTPR